MSVGSELLTSAAFFGAAITILGYFIRRWMERIEAKVDALIESKGKLVSRDEYDKGITRVHQRIDEHLAEEHELADRVTKLEGQVQK